MKITDAQISIAANAHGQKCDPLNQTLEKQADQIMGFGYGAKWVLSQPDFMKEKLEELRDEYLLRLTVLSAMLSAPALPMLSVQRLKTKQGCYNTFVVELNKILTQ